MALSLPELNSSQYKMFDLAKDFIKSKFGPERTNLHDKARSIAEVQADKILGILVQSPHLMSEQEGRDKAIEQISKEVEGGEKINQKDLEMILLNLRDNIDTRFENGSVKHPGQPLYSQEAGQVWELLKSADGVKDKNSLYLASALMSKLIAIDIEALNLSPVEAVRKLAEHDIKGYISPDSRDELLAQFNISPEKYIRTISDEDEQIQVLRNLVYSAQIMPGEAMKFLKEINVPYKSLR